MMALVGAQSSDKMEPNAIVQLERLYQLLLGRALDEAGLADKALRLEAGDVSVIDIVAEIVSSTEYAGRLLDRPVASTGSFLNDHSQFGEIGLLIRAIVNEASASRWVVDIGARGRDRSNSFDLLREFGWRGLLVEANPRLLATIAREFEGLDVRIVGAAVSDFTGRATFTIGINDDVSSLSQDTARTWGETRGSIDVDVVRLPELLREHDVPRRFELLSIDIEGEDIKVLNDLIDRSAYRPEWIIIEASHDFSTRSLADVGASAIVQASYGLFAQTKANLLLRHVGHGAGAATMAVPVIGPETDLNGRLGNQPASEQLSDFAAGEMLPALGRLLTPHAVAGFAKVRVGDEGDGGYVMLDDFDGVRTAFSLGIGDNVSWDRQLADRGITIHQFDPTVSGPPVDHPNYTFYPLRIASSPGDGIVTLGGLRGVANLASDSDGQIVDILKIDIEHDEWDAFLATDANELSRYRQIICEFHRFDLAGDRLWGERALAVLQKLNEHYQCIHVHGNNFAPYSVVGGVAFPSVLEATFVNRRIYDIVDEDGTFPTGFDSPNNSTCPDYYLGRFEF